MQTLTIEQPISSHLAGPHPAWLSITLHLLPGILIGAVYYLLALPAARLGLPSIAAQLASGLLVLVPFELGIIAWAAKKSSPRPVPFIDMIEYRERIPLWQTLALVFAVLVATGVIFSLLSPVTQFLQKQFSFLSGPWMVNIGLEGSFPKSTLIWVTILNALLVAIIFPTVEELYFRGFLLPRMPAALKGWTPLAHTILFAAYHTWSPWLFVARAIGVLPLVYAVRWKRNIYIGIITHCLLNMIDIVTVALFISRLP